MATVRRTVTLTDRMSAAIDAAVDDGLAPSTSALMAQAVEYYLAHTGNDRLAQQAELLDEDAELQLIDRVRAGVSQGWDRLRDAR